VNEKIAALNRALVGLAGVGSPLLADMQGQAIMVGGQRGPTYDDIAYEAKVRFHVSGDRGSMMRVRIIVLEG
jgi:hypothetical protein